MILTLIAEAVLGTVVEHAGDALKKRFTTDAAQRSFALALGQAVNDYIQTVGAAVAQPLLKDDGILTLPLVQNELAQVIRFERGRDITLIGREWRDALDTFVGPRDFSRDAMDITEWATGTPERNRNVSPSFYVETVGRYCGKRLSISGRVD